jgi:hypothetical protein
MISPADLLAIAEDLTSRIPNDESYADERNACWLAIGKALLKENDFNGASRALGLMTGEEAQAELRVAAIRWSGDNPENDVARDLVRNTVDHIDLWEPLIYRNDLANLVKPICKVLGTDAVHTMSWKLRDPFTAGNVLVSLAGLINDPGVRRETLRSAEEFAKGVRPGDRDYALRWVVAGYKSAGLEEDEQRARAEMSQELELMCHSEANLLEQAEKALQLRVGPEPDPDTPLLRLRRFLNYGYNDLRVSFLIDRAEAGGLDDAEIEQLISDSGFLHIARARPPSIYNDPSHFTVQDLARSLFDRAVRQHDDDWPLLAGEGFLEISDRGRFLSTVKDLFRNFGETAERFSPEQIDQGLWYLFGEPFWLGTQLQSPEIPPAQISELTQSMYYPFRDYYLKREPNYDGSAFYMWWDNLSMDYLNPALPPAAVAVLQDILALPNQGCRHAALHGLCHLFPDPRAASIIDRYLEENRASMSEEEIEWVKLCRVGQAH